jgi:hypothetical protein
VRRAAFAAGWEVGAWLLPVASVLAFVVLYLAAAWLYPGGSRVDPTSSGFSWVHNYWCDLLDATTYGGQPNPARPVARAAMAILCGGLGVLWMATPRLFRPRRAVRSWVVRIAGVGCALVTPWVGMGFHDLAVRVAGALGAIAFGTTLTALPGESRALRAGGATVLALVAANYFIWETRIGLVFLAPIQKVVFAGFLAWVVVLALRLRATR